MSDNATPPSPRGRLGLFEATGVELEYMILGGATLDVSPTCDLLMQAAAGAPESEVERGDLAWSNELVLHVLEMKTNGPAATLEGLAARFQASVREANALLAAQGALLAGSAMHPWMDPHTEARLWPHEYGAVYQAYDRLFDCRGHGWANLQSTHINLPFDGDDEFDALHTAIRLLLPLLPALAASSPFQEGGDGPWADSRLWHYMRNQARFPIIAGDVVPEPARSEQEYRELILDPIRAQVIEPHDTEGVLSPHFVNSRGAIARFDRGSIEIRLLDIQECPAADLAIVQLVVAVLRQLAHDGAKGRARQRALPTARLAALFRQCAEHAGNAPVDDAEYLAALGCDAERPVRASDVWKALARSHGIEPPAVAHGTLSSRMREARQRGASLHDIVARLAACLAEGRVFLP